MRNIVTTNSSPDVAEEYAEAVEQLLLSQNPDRETTQNNQFGQLDFFVRLYHYQAPGTDAQVWAVDYSDPVSRELVEFDDCAAADALYEEDVHNAAENMGEDSEGLSIRFASTDVDGVPGPLPELPEVETEDLGALLDSPSDRPVLYLDDSQEELAVAVGDADRVPEAAVVLTRETLLAELSRDDTNGRLTWEDLAEEDHFVGVRIAEYMAHKRVKAAADALLS